MAVALAVAGFVLLPIPVASQEDVALEEIESVPARLFSETDAAGGNWTMARQGYVESGGTCPINRAAVLTVDGGEFNPERFYKAASEPRWVLRGRVNELEVERDIYFDRERGGVRYLDTFRNLAGEEVSAVVAYGMGFRYPWLKLHTSQGKEFDGKLGVRDGGIFVRMPEDRQNQGVLLLLAGERSSRKPGIELASKQEIVARYTLQIPAGTSRAVVYWIAQEQLSDPELIKDVTARFYRQQLLTDVHLSRDASAAVLNFDLAAAGAGVVEPHNEGLLVALNELTDRLGLIRTGQDMLWVARDSQLSGLLEGKPIQISSRFGDFEIPVREIAAIQGGGGRGREPKVYLRDGTVMPGGIVAEGLHLEGNDGWELDLNVAQLEYLFGRIATADGKTGDATNVFVQLHSGDVCGVEATDADGLQFAAPWGSFRVPIAQIRTMSYLSLPSPRYRLMLADGSRITAFLIDQKLRLRASRFGEIDLSAGELSSLWSVAGEAPELVREIRGIEDISGFDHAVCLLKGDNLIAGSLANQVLHVVSGTTVTALKPDEIVAINRTFDDASELMPVFELELKGGDLLVGTLREDMIEIVAPHNNWSVPVTHFVAARMPEGKK